MVVYIVELMIHGHTNIKFMGLTDGRDEKIMQKKAGKRPKRLKVVKEIEGNFLLYLMRIGLVCACMPACVCECLVLHIQYPPTYTTIPSYIYNNPLLHIQQYPPTYTAIPSAPTTKLFAVFFPPQKFH